MDLFGHVNNIAFFKYIQAARVNFWENIGLTDLYRTRSFGPILASCKCDFLAELNYPGKVKVVTIVTKVGKTSFELTHKLYNQNEILVSNGFDIVVCYDFGNKSKVNIPDEIRSSLCRHQS
jgi:acyl-CoA thioester hydrolase